MLMFLDIRKLETLKLLLSATDDAKLMLCLDEEATLCVRDRLFNPSIFKSDSPPDECGIELVALDAPRLTDVRREDGDEVRDDTLGVDA